MYAIGASPAAGSGHNAVINKKRQRTDASTIQRAAKKHLERNVINKSQGIEGDTLRTWFTFMSNTQAQNQ